MARNRCLSITAMCSGAMCFCAPSHAVAAPGSLVCVIHDCALHVNLIASYFYGVPDTLATARGNGGILWDGAPKPLKRFDFELDAVGQLKIDNRDLVLNLTKTALDGKRSVQALLKIEGKRVPDDPTTFRATYRLEIVRADAATAAASRQSVTALAVKRLHAVNGYAECSAT